MTRTPLLVTIDVEGSPRNDGYHCVETLDRTLRTLSIPATLFVTPDVIEQHPDIVATWIELGHTVGLHVHPDRLGGESDWLETYGQDELESFLATGRDTFEDTLGAVPRGFRAGRWSFSDSLLRALGNLEFKWDASFRSVTAEKPYISHGILEYPMSVYGNQLIRRMLKSYGIDGIPLHADAFLRSRCKALLLYTATWRVARANPEYVMVSLHDYDLSDQTVRRRIERYLARLSEWLTPVTLTDVHEERTYNQSDDRL